MIKKGINRRDFLRLFGFGLAGAGALELLDLTTENKATKFLKEITIGFEGTVEAVSADYVCDGTDDDVQWQAALDALPASGGKLVALAGNYVFGATVSRAIDNVTIEGTGYGSYFAYNASTALFSIGSQTRWTFRDLRLDAGGITTASASDWIFENIYIGATYYLTGGDISAQNVSYVLDEDTMSSNSDTAVPTQQSVKAYVDSHSPIITTKYKSVTETVNNSTTLQNDDDLYFSAEANKSYLVFITLAINSNSTADFKMGWSYPSGCNIWWGVPSSSMSLGADTLVSQTMVLSKSTNDFRQCFLIANVFNGANAGTVNFQWAQNTANASDTSLYYSSNMVIIKLN